MKDRKTIRYELLESIVSALEPMVARKVNAGACVHDILSTDQFVMIHKQIRTFRMMHEVNRKTRRYLYEQAEKSLPQLLDGMPLDTREKRDIMA